MIIIQEDEEVMLPSKKEWHYNGLWGKVQLIINSVTINKDPLERVTQKCKDINKWVNREWRL